MGLLDRAPKGYRHMGRARKRDLRLLRLIVGPELTTQREEYRHARRQRRLATRSAAS